MDVWKVIETGFEPEKLRWKETVFTLGNGYLGTRGAFEEGYPGDQPATLLHGLFDDAPIVFTELVNCPNWLDLALYINGERFRMDRGRILEYHRELDMRTATLTRRVRWQSPRGETVALKFERFASLADEHALAVRCEAQAVDFSGMLEFRAGIAGHVDNAGAMLHWQWVDQGSQAPQTAYLHVRTKSTRIPLVEAAHLSLQGGQGHSYNFWDSPWQPTLVGRAQVRPGEAVTAEKLVAIYSGRDDDDPLQAAQAELERIDRQGYSRLYDAHAQAWAREWELCDITIEGDERSDHALRFSLFGLLIAAPRNDDRVSIGAKSLSGFGYRGHVFWDTDIFILPFFTYTRPEIARNLLMYRYHTLPGARDKAQGSGYTGAMYAWESAATGHETTPRWIPLMGSPELVRIWCGDIEHHISADVAYAVHQYWRVTGDDDFMRDYGAEVVLDTARFWGSRVEWHPEMQRYEINDVIGPDEYHDHVNNNAFTNGMARWNLQTALSVLDWLERQAPAQADRLRTALDLSPERLEHWRDVIDRIYLAYDPETRLFEQFEGYFKLKFRPLSEYEPRQISMQALLGVQGVQAWQYIKQPDVLMLLYLLDQPAYSEYGKALQANWDYYLPRTDLTYGSSLGPSIMAALAARKGIGDIDMPYKHFIHAALTDLEDNRGNTEDGFHAATAGGLWQAAVLGFGGLDISGTQPAANANLPRNWSGLRFKVKVGGQSYPVRLVSSGGAPQPRLPVLGAIFDLDGVLTDTSEYHYRAWQRLADEEGLPFNRQENEALRGIPRRESLLVLLKGKELPEAQMQEFMERKNRYYQESIAGLSPDDLLPGAVQMLDELRAAGIKIAIGSASKNAGSVIERLGIAGLIDAISEGNSVERQKPAPDLFLHAARQLGLLPAQCVVFEDAGAGISAALAGGMWAVGLGPPDRVGAAHVIIPSLEGRTWAGIEALLIEEAE